MHLAAHLPVREPLPPPPILGVFKLHACSCAATHPPVAIRIKASRPMCPQRTPALATLVTNILIASAGICTARQVPERFAAHACSCSASYDATASRASATGGATVCTHTIVSTRCACSSFVLAFEFESPAELGQPQLQRERGNLSRQHPPITPKMAISDESPFHVQLQGSGMPTVRRTACAMRMSQTAHA